MRDKKIIACSVLGVIILLSSLAWIVATTIVDKSTPEEPKIEQKQTPVETTREMKLVEGFFLAKSKKSVEKSGYIVDSYNLPTYAERLSTFMKNSGINDGTVDKLSINDFYVTETGNLAVKYGGFIYIYTGKQVIGVFGDKDENFFEKIKDVYNYMEVGTDFLSGKIGVYDPKYIAYRTEKEELQLPSLDQEIKFKKEKPKTFPKDLEGSREYSFQSVGESYNSRGNFFTFLSYSSNKDNNTYFFNSDGIFIGGIFENEEDFLKKYDSLRFYGPTKIGKFEDKFLVILEVT